MFHLSLILVIFLVSIVQIYLVSAFMLLFLKLGMNRKKESFLTFFAIFCAKKRKEKARVKAKQQQQQAFCLICAFNKKTFWDHRVSNTPVDRI